MNMEKIEEKIERLKKKGVVLTLQRLFVLETLGKNVHATAEDIYQRFVKKYPTVSRATIYSCLDVLKQAGEIQELTIRKEMSCFDFEPHPHHHFLCRKCGKIFDVEISCPVARKGRVEGHRIDDVQAYFYGTCRGCIAREKKANKSVSTKRRKR